MVINNNWCRENEIIKKALIEGPHEEEVKEMGRKLIEEDIHYLKLQKELRVAASTTDYALYVPSFFNIFNCFLLMVL